MYRPVHYVHVRKAILLKYKLPYTNGLCVSFIDRGRTALTAVSNEDVNKALSPEEGVNYLIYSIFINFSENALKFVRI